MEWVIPFKLLGLLRHLWCYNLDCKQQQVLHRCKNQAQHMNNINLGMWHTEKTATTQARTTARLSSCLQTWYLSVIFKTLIMYNCAHPRRTNQESPRVEVWKKNTGRYLVVLGQYRAVLVGKVQFGQFGTSICLTNFYQNFHQKDVGVGKTSSVYCAKLSNF